MKAQTNSVTHTLPMSSVAFVTATIPIVGNPRLDRGILVLRSPTFVEAERILTLCRVQIAPVLERTIVSP